ncbi:MAG: hypothetical protein COW19_07075 [Zetaproteobacteria bacterium CG12_big_fil_rev_8_21_14_0_65_55_1124]|nr:MAG: hypothetical protein AUJ58_02675 [Zetaproteobacteria bacterium CG1_02_55_237]PIS19611.1 MAG: hypothetical protein COT53_05140 [Zetaproteobacteria bacterium CG08_land_8_20_14_0_20_55_17]PIW42682.1 MAG: hypothetical protein COW19_07075 [Zetaproteobacteria bacterium CG12_big_fil_rev_8_21_14_0_65_55_1124]PIY52047.1 MAG: hypothetical protein COZ01_09250 [Zetaproteobacteria bacterium CG_4_10_14_0_8_um_filter_55_43]PIZ38974.1 MAG: hypothetical protein COY36_04510 [Zetaproteobacteria bacterium 
MEKIKKLSNNKKRKVQELLGQATQAMRLRRLDVLESLLQKVDRIQPNNPDVANFRGVLAIQNGRFEHAETFFVRAINAAPRRADFHLNLGKLYLTQGMPFDALKRFKSATTLEPKSVEAAIGLVQCLIRIGEHKQACTILEPLLAVDPANTDLLLAMFRACFSLAKLERARACLDNVLAIQADCAEAHLGIAQIALQEGDFKEAQREAREALRLAPNNSSLYTFVSDVTKFRDPDDDILRAMLDQYRQSAGRPVDRTNLAFALAKAMGDMGNVERAWEFIMEGNNLRHEQSTYNADEELVHMQEIMRFYTPDVCMRNSGIEDETPIFILGMPRCGSTLSEQILAAHPDVVSRGESETFVKNALLDYHSDENVLTLERMTSFSPDQWRELGTAYLQRLRSDMPDAKRITDKSLTNIRYVGAIHCTLPRARIIHVRRNPLDTCFSIFKNNLAGGQFGYGFNLGELGYYYRMYLKLMQHWRDVLPSGAMYEMDYEALVTNQEEETRKLLDYCGLPWSDDCLQFTQVRNVVSTTSVAQVRRSIYKDSVAAWKPYEQHLQPLIRILGIS